MSSLEFGSCLFGLLLCCLRVQIGTGDRRISSGSAFQMRFGSPSAKASQTQASIPPTTKRPVWLGGALSGSISLRTLSSASAM